MKKETEQKKLSEIKNEIEKLFGEKFSTIRVLDNEMRIESDFEDSKKTNMELHAYAEELGKLIEIRFEELECFKKSGSGSRLSTIHLRLSSKYKELLNTSLISSTSKKQEILNELNSTMFKVVKDNPDCPDLAVALNSLHENLRKYILSTETVCYSYYISSDTQRLKLDSLEGVQEYLSDQSSGNRDLSIYEVISETEEKPILMVYNVESI